MRPTRIRDKIMGIFSNKVEQASKEGRLNEGQYKFKPWMANVIMFILEFILVMGWLFGGILSAFSIAGNLDLGLIEEWDMATSFILAGLYLVWNMLVWFIKPLRTRFNYKCTFWNLIFIAWLIVTALF